MKLKLDEEGRAVLEDGKPVYVSDDGTETAIDGAGVLEAARKARSERDAADKRAKDATSRMKSLGANEEEIAQALETVRALGSNELVEAGKLDEAVKERVTAATKDWERKQREYENAVRERDAHLDRLLISQQFASTGVLEDYYLTPDLAEAAFSKHFVREGDTVVPYRRIPDGNGDAGERIYRRDNPNELADFNDALSQLLESHPNAPKWKRASGTTGSGAPGSGETVTAGGKEYSEMSHVEKAAAIRQKVGTRAA